MKLLAPQLLLIASAGATVPLGLFSRQESCPQIHVFGARETTAPPGFGSSQTIVDLVLNAFPGATSESIIYPAAGGNSYAMSVATGVRAITNQTQNFARRCPSARIVMIGYSQGSQIMDDAFCGGPDGQSLMAATALVPIDVGLKVAAMIWLGNPRYVDGLPYNVGTARLGGFAARPANFVCAAYEGIIQSYCDAPDPFCSKGNSTMTHQGYGQVYGQRALNFIKSKLETQTTARPSSTPSFVPSAGALSKPDMLGLLTAVVSLIYVLQ